MNRDFKSERKAIYFDCICGTICAITALVGIFYFTMEKGILYPVNFTIGLTFFIGYLFISLFVIGLGLYTYYKAKHFDPDSVPKDKLRAPMVG